MAGLRVSGVDMFWVGGFRVRVLGVRMSGVCVCVCVVCEWQVEGPCVVSSCVAKLTGDKTRQTAWTKLPTVDG